MPSRSIDIQLHRSSTRPSAVAAFRILVRGSSTAQALLLALGVLSLGLVLLLAAVRWAGWAPYIVSGESMKPTIVPGSLVLTQGTLAEGLRPGQVVVFPALWAKVAGEPRTVVHRLVRVTPVEGGVLGYTQGDGTESPDPGPTLFKGPVALVTAVVPYLGYVYTFTEKWGLLLVALGMAPLLVPGVLYRSRSRPGQSGLQ